MTPDVKRRLHFWYGICLAVLTVIVGILFISQAADIYYSGEGYSRELVIERCTAIAAPFWIWIAAIVAGGIIWMIYPAEKKKLKRLPDARGDVERFYKLAAKQSDKEGFDEAAKAVARERKVRRIVWISCMVICLICAGVGLYYLFNLPEYPSDPNEAVLRLVRTTLICVIVAFIACCGATVFDTISAKKILPKARQMLALAGRDAHQNKSTSKFYIKLHSTTIKKIIKIIIIIFSLIVIAGLITCLVCSIIGIHYNNFYNMHPPLDSNGNIDEVELQNIKNEIVSKLLNVVLPCGCVSFIISCCATVYDGNKASAIAEQNNLVTSLPKSNGLLLLRITLLVIAITFIILGIVNGGMADVLGKAINICTECIGLG